MMKYSTVLLAGCAFLAAPSQAQDEEATPVKDFFMAADAGDTEAMAAAMNPDRGVSSKKLLKKIRDCYLSNVRDGPSSQFVAVWTCDEGPEKSRSIIADVSRTNGGAQVDITGERNLDYPAAPRPGPAFTIAGS